MAKRVVSVSLGASRRDSVVQVELLGEEVVLDRRGTDGDFQKALRLIAELDGKVDAIGLGGIDLYLWAGGRRYTIRDAKRLKEAARKTPVVDGSGLKHTLERRAVAQLAGLIDWKSTKVLLPSAVDRFGLAEALHEAGAKVLYGDFIFALGLPIPLYSLSFLQKLAFVFLPVLTQLPFQLLYPTGEKQGKRAVDWRSRYYTWADLVAGDWHYIKRHMPDEMRGKMVLTNTTTEEDVAFLRERGVKRLITTTPRLNGRSFGTNVMEALLVALAGRELGEEEYLRYIDLLGLRPQVLDLQEET
ncbi:quinate 5-dehydrogenase [Thermus scotoductus]|uniref:Quinate 5-dehydrogenase n=1 Tax=Thermus scotoductus TaxID=37636 RepID=A0A430R429_THESC|nr:quinate 5-dehydrogenase [Thermus scotoductus]RTG95045.1 quinate 5-dehydrogenase [Thermus scotoductus]RTH02103.1 quinate 5-dehydrogenase [Thermus scotoductus]RTH20093.1 quinate 5-dehydrogenase [Thermus scotoductus]RTH96135.1 quinate 5-dehydrogenase [Thermus scotoductus]RTI21488.1 quinate 5-dehydrogenase [Thermus scotoductus]